MSFLFRYVKAKFTTSTLSLGLNHFAIGLEGFFGGSFMIDAFKYYPIFSTGLFDKSKTMNKSPILKPCKRSFGTFNDLLILWRNSMRGIAVSI